MVVLHDPVQHRVSNRSVTDPFVPMLNGQLTGDDRGFSARPVVDHLQQVRARLRIHPHQAPVIERQHIRVLQDVQPTRERAIGVPVMQNHHRLTLTGESLRKARLSQKREENQG